MKNKRPWRRRSEQPWNYLHSTTFRTKSTMCIAKVKGFVFILVSIESFEVVDRRR
jgi:hypothetical protein